jgi:hypothetical protein
MDQTQVIVVKQGQKINSREKRKHYHKHSKNDED